MGYQETLELYLSLSRRELQSLCKRNSLPANRSHGQLAESLASLFKACDTDGRAVSACPDENLSREGFGCSTSAPKDTSLKPFTPANMQGTTKVQPLSYQWHDNGAKSSPSKSFELKNPIQRPMNHGTNNLSLISCGNKRVDQGSTESRIVSSDQNSAKTHPSFEFFVMSEDGIDLCVDLCSSPSEWINSLKGDVCIHQKVEHCTSELQCNQLRGLEDADENGRVSSSGNVGTGLPSHAVDINTRCTNSSLSSVVSENCHSEPCVLDATVVTSRSFALTPTSSPIESSKGLEGNHMVSSSCLIASCADIQMASDIASCCRDENILRQEAGKDSLKLKNSDTSVHDTSLKSTNKMDASSPNGMRNLDLGFTTNSDGVDSSNVKVTALGDTLVDSSGKNKPSTADNVQDDMVSIDIGKMRNHVGLFKISVEGGPVEGQQEAAGFSDMSLHGQLILDCPLTDSQSEVGSADHLVNGHQCGNPGKSANEDLMSATSDGQDRSIPVKYKENLECSQFQNPLGRALKRYHSQEVPVDIQNKKQHLHSDDGTAMNLINMKSWPKESQCDTVVLPRRSTRLSKV